ncbi:MAG: pyruvate, phosphate dikinase [Spirochaetaceae bacterium]|nr:MAG: pyruvate, phosphate dikinase [Spirochaetaceae bacterium]
MKTYHAFNSKEFLSDPAGFDELGSRGKRVMELASLGLPIAPGFVLTSETLGSISDNPASEKDFLLEPVRKMEGWMEKGFDNPENPMLIKVVESPMLNMVNTFSTIHNIGLHKKTIAGFAKHVGDDFAYHELANVLIKMMQLERLGEVTTARKKKLDAFEAELRKAKKKAAVEKSMEKYADVYPEEVLTDGFAQLVWVIDRYKALFATRPTSEDSALMVQSMVFGNYGQESYFGSYYTHDIIAGEDRISGEFFPEAFDDRKVAGKPIEKITPKVRKELERIAAELESRFKEIRQVRFTVESGKLWVIDQFAAENRSTQAEIKTLLDLHRKGVVDAEYVINAIKPGRLSELLHPALDLTSVKKFGNIAGGIAGAVGAAIGRVYFSTDALLKEHRRATQSGEDNNLILAMPSTYAEDVKAIEVAKGVLSTEGGYASHAPVVARSLGKVALVFPGGSFAKTQLKIGNKTIKEGDYVTLSVPYYDDPTIYLGKASLTEPNPSGSGLLELLDLIQEQIGDFDVEANADQPKDAELAAMFKAAGIGLCRTEHMFFADNRINEFRSMILAGDKAQRVKSLSKLETMQVSDFYKLFKIMAGKPVTIRLLDAPLHEFLPHGADSMKQFVSFMKKKYPKMTAADVQQQCDLLKEVNPMLGHRGVRVAISYPEIYNMQVRAIFEAAYKLKKEKIEAVIEIMVPLVMSANEIKAIRNGKHIEGKEIVGIKEIEEEVRKKHKSKPVHYRVGTMIELPAAALHADRIARYADFFSFGTNDLTQTTNGLSRDDFNNFFSDYNEFDLLEENPFKVLGEQVKEMIAIATERGRLTRPDLRLGLCGEHGAEPENIAFTREIGLNYVSCSPYGIPIAKLAIAQMNIAKKAESK